jgi:hypothetical protein
VVALLEHAQRWLRVGTPDEMGGAATRSHLPDRRCVGWCGPVPSGWTLAVDAEVASAAVPPALAARFGTDRFWARWTLAECLCKLADQPMPAWWRRHGLAPPGNFAGLWRTLPLDDLVVSVAAAPAAGTTATAAGTIAAAPAAGGS